MINQVFMTSYGRAKFIISRNRHLLIFGVTALVATDLTGMAIPWLIKGGIDTLVSKNDSGSSLVVFPLLILGAALLQGFFRYLWRINIHGFSRRAEADLRDQVFSHLLKLPLPYFQHMKTGDLMSRMTNDIQAVRELLGFGSLAIVDAATVISLSLVFMIAIDPWLTLCSLIAMPLITITVRFFGRHIFRCSQEVQQQLSHLSAYVHENVAGIRVVQAYAQEDNHIRAFEMISAEYLRKNLWLATLWGVFWPLMKVVAGAAAAIVLWLGGRRVLSGTMTLGEFVAFNGYLAMLTWPLMAVGHVVNQYQRGTAALSRIGEILDRPISPGHHSEAPKLSGSLIRGYIEIRDLTFSYGGGNPVALRGVSLTIPAGSTCGIIGEVGSGKSTLVHLLLRLFEPPAGRIFLDGVDIRTIQLAKLRETIGFVSQDIFLFAGTIRENILFGSGDDRGADFEEAARIAGLLPTVKQFKTQFDTLLGERGVRLSGGQRQRTALARAIVRNPPVLILDDAFSAVDTETEEAILSQLEQYREGKGLILISQRVSTVQRADLIVVMKAGEVIEQGTHDELLSRRGAYYRLCLRQRLVREVEELNR
ncbi:MAG: ABC transporter ATP-binding protein [Deltaproteobacteria bacterium]|nr:ABC transporter ATP-binding protein [Deltaproteobacteria bacterium]